MKYPQLTKCLVVFLIGGSCALAAFGQSQDTYTNTRKMLATMKDVKNNSDQLAKLFRVGDERIADLVKALDDPDPDISLRAQILIRYLGSDTGVIKLLEWFKTQERFRVAGPIPIPLQERDYKVIHAQYLSVPPEKWVRSEPYIYALALDGSPRAKEALDEMIKIAGNLDEATVANRAAKRVQAGQPTKLLTGQQDLAKLVLNSAFFVSPDDRKYTSARLLALNGAKDKALVEVYINRGVLAEEWYHVVIQKCEQGWRFFSVTQVALS